MFCRSTTDYYLYQGAEIFTAYLWNTVQCSLLFIVIERRFNILVISLLGSLGVYQKAVYFYCCVFNVSFVKFTDFNFYDICIWWLMVKLIVVMKIQPRICLDHKGKPRKNPSQVGRYRDLNQGPSDCESHALPGSHLGLYYAVYLPFSVYFLFFRRRTNL